MTWTGNEKEEMAQAALTEHDLRAKIGAIKAEIKDEYRGASDRPWIIGFSGGKDSTLVLHLVVESLLELPFSERTRPVHVVANDTLVESPIVQSYVDMTLAHLREALTGLQLPIEVIKTSPATDQTFWVNLIGRGYPAPTRLFRWCTDRMKIRPTWEFIKRETSNYKEVVLLLGVRRNESSARAKVAKRYDNGGRLNPHNDIQGCLVYRPILELSTEDVWEYLTTNPAPWGGDHKALMALYRNAAGGECPIVIDADTQPSCGSSSIRFGCWTCTVVEKDKSFRNAMEKGFEHLIPMAEFRDWLQKFCYTVSNRMPERRNGSVGLGPLTFEARQEILDKLKDLEQNVGISLISHDEVAAIKSIWQQDRSSNLIRKVDRLIALIAK